MRYAPRLLAAGFVVVALAFLAGFFAPRDDDFFALRKNFQLFGAVYEELVGNYVDDLDPERTMRTGIEAMLEDLDPYTVFFDEATNAEAQIRSRGRYGSVGLNVQIRDEQVTVSAPDENASGYRQGVRAGDIITHIEGQPTEGLSLTDVWSLLSGEPGTGVEVTILRAGEPEPLRFLLTREEFAPHDVSYTGFLDDDTTAGIGYVKLERFAGGAATETRRAVQLLDQAGPLKGIILDLRDNPGGLLEAAVSISGLFVEQGATVVTMQGRTPGTARMYRNETPPLLPEVPLVVLVNNYSASASEIVAGAVQDLDRGIIMGETSYGKGLVQIVKPLPYNTSIKITTAKYYTPSGRSIQAIDYGQHDGRPTTVPDSLRRTFHTAAGRAVKDGRGIEPDVAVSFGPESELEQALQRRAAFFFFANHYAASHPAVPLDFTVSDALLREFQQWLGTQNFSYRTTAERDVEHLAEKLAASGYTAADDEIAALEAAVGREKAADFERHAPRLKEQLRSEIVARYHDRTGQVKASLANDVQVKRAAALLADARAYERALQ